MRSGVIIAWPKEGKPPVVKYFERYQEARDESAKLRDDDVKHELWSSGSGVERRVRGGKSCVNMDAAKHIPSEAQKLAWATKAKEQLAAKEQEEIAAASKPKEPAKPKDDPNAAKELTTEEIDETNE
jgi:hypothetical protein